MNYGVIVAAGRSDRMGPDVDKTFLSLGTQPVLAYSLQAFEKCQDIDGVILVARKDKVDAARGMVQLFGCSKVKRVVAGGSKRQFSVANGLEALPDEVKIVAVHDGARPCVTPHLISETVHSAKKHGSGVAACKVTDTIKLVERGFKVARTVDRDKLWAVQTPQAFRIDLLLAALEKVRKENVTVTDEASAMELFGQDVHLVMASPTNIKITTADDLQIAAALLKL